MIAYELQGFGVKHLKRVERPVPKVGPGQALVKMLAAGLNARDLQIMNGLHPIGRSLPLVPLSDGVGEVVEVAEGVTRVRPGDRVTGIFAQRWLDGPRTADTWGSTLGGDLDGMLQKFAVLDATGLVHVPEHLTDEEGATLATAGVTAWQALVTAGRVRPGDTVLLQGTGAVSLFALQFALLSGARTIITSQSDAKLARARSLGASDIVSRVSTDWVEQVRRLTGGEGVDHVVDVSGDLQASIACLRIGGLVSQVGYLARTRLEAEVFPVLLTNARIHGISVGPRATFEDMNRAIALHRMRPQIDRVFEFEDAVQAFERFSTPERFGKVVIRFP